VAGPKAGAIVPMEIFVEQEQIPPVRVRLEDWVFPMDWASPVGTSQGQVGKAAREFGRDEARFKRTRMSAVIQCSSVVSVALSNRQQPRSFEVQPSE